VNIRPYQPQERDLLCGLAVSVFAEASIDHEVEARLGLLNGTTWQDRKRRDIGGDLDANPGGCFVAEFRGEAVGFITTTVDHETGVGRIPNLAVSAAYQGRGLGRALLARALDYFVAEGLGHAQIETLDTNERGQHLYPALGFGEVARKIYYYTALDERRDR
jgi:ribosomal protein S18 acetylase RimI-like enzyme